MKNKGVPAAKDGLMHKIERSFNKAQPKIAKTKILEASTCELNQELLRIEAGVQPEPKIALIVPASSAKALAKEDCRLFKIGLKIYSLEKIASGEKAVQDHISWSVYRWAEQSLRKNFLSRKRLALQGEIKNNFIQAQLSRSDDRGHLTVESVLNEEISHYLNKIDWKGKSLLICTEAPVWVENRTSHNYVFHHAEADGAYYAQITCEQEENGCFFPIKVYSRAKNEDVSSQLVDTGKESTLERAKIEAENMMLCLKALDQKKAKKPARKRSTA